MKEKSYVWPWFRIFTLFCIIVLFINIAVIYNITPKRYCHEETTIKKIDLQGYHWDYKTSSGFFIHGLESKDMYYETNFGKKDTYICEDNVTVLDWGNGDLMLEGMKGTCLIKQIKEVCIIK